MPPPAFFSPSSESNPSHPKTWVRRIGAATVWDDRCHLDSHEKKDIPEGAEGPGRFFFPPQMFSTFCAERAILNMHNNLL